LSDNSFFKRLRFSFFSRLQFYFSAQNAHDLHSPFAFDFYCRILKGDDKKKRVFFERIENKRREFLKSDTALCGAEYGALGNGSLIRERLGALAAISLKSPSRARLISRIASMNSAGVIIELGTCLGLTTAYLASTLPDSKVISLEGNHARADIAASLFAELNLLNIHLVKGEFSEELPAILNKIQLVDFVFLDGNHKKVPTLKYFEMIKKKVHQDTIIIVDDIRWSPEMFNAWQQITSDDLVQTSIELYDMGILFFRQNFTKHNFKIRG